MAKQDQSDTPAATGDGGVENSQEASKSSALFAKVVIPAFVLASIGLGGWLAYDHYGQVDRVVGVAQETFSSVWGDSQGIQYGEFLELEGLIVNPAGTQGQRYLMVALGLEARSQSALSEVENKEVVVRDTVLKILSRYNVEQLASLNHRNKTKKELLDAVNSVLGRRKIDRLYFTQYVLQ